MQELCYISTILDQERYRDKRQPAAEDDALYAIVDDGSPGHAGEHTFAWFS
jgi:hypothetical protein